MTAAALKEDLERISLANMAKAALRENAGDVKLAIAALVRTLNDQKHLIKEIVADAIYEAADTLVKQQNIGIRRALFNPNRIAKDTRETVVALARGIKASLLDFPLSDGSKLRDATPDKVTPLLNHCETQGRDLMHKARWLRHIIQTVPAGQKIGDHVTDERAKELWEATIDA